MDAYEYQNNIIIDLTIKFLSGDISQTEMSQLDSLLEENSENKNIFNELKMSWCASGAYPNNQMQEEALVSWEKVSGNITREALPNLEDETKTIGFNRILRIAALWLMLISLGSFVTWRVMLSSHPSDSGKFCMITTPLGSKSHMVLPDGSDVWLNAGTTIRYPNIFSTKQRDIFLTGEAYFKVASNKKWPFVVHTSDLNIKAVGTAFNVKAYPSEKTVTTTLVEGVVKLENDKRNFSYTLKPKQELVFLKEQGVKKSNSASDEKLKPSNDMDKKLESIENAVVKNEINTETSVSWKDKHWIIQGETIENLAIMLERRYDIKINVLSDELNRFRFSGTIENETIEQVLNYLKYTIPMKYTISKGSVDLKIDNALKEKYKVFLKKEELSNN